MHYDTCTFILQPLTVAQLLSLAPYPTIVSTINNKLLQRPWPSKAAMASRSRVTPDNSHIALSQCGRAVSHGGDQGLGVRLTQIQDFFIKLQSRSISF